MAQSDLTIQNQSFPSFRADLNDALTALNSMQSGTSRPASAVAGTMWLDTTNATNPTIKFFDGTDDITFATVDYSANTINFSDSASDLLTDTTPQLGGMLDVNGQAIGNGTEELIKFLETASAVNEITVTNSATGTAPEISATGDDTDIDLKITPKGAGNLILDGFEFPNIDGTAGQVLQTDGYANLSFGSAGSTSYGLFSKINPAVVAWNKTGSFTMETNTGLYIEVNGDIKTIASGTSITMPGSATDGTDYAIWCTTSGALEATTDHVSPPSANARKVGGFHYAPGENATGVAGGNTTPSINVYSLWDLKWRPGCSDPRGMTLVGGHFWSDIYLTGVDHHTNGTSKYDVTIADGSSPPKVPTLYGGDGSTTYGSYTWWECAELLSSHGKRPPTYQEFSALAYGTTEASSRGTDPVTTQMSATDDNFTSKWGVIQSTGCLLVWGNHFGGGALGASFVANTEGRGSTYQLSNVVKLGGIWSHTSDSGSRNSEWDNRPTSSDLDIGSRGVCDHKTNE